tara:strand:+ start:263301 stop:263810 length:510 start_codon:yes stop_codon:yes gene_type:complete
MYESHQHLSQYYAEHVNWEPLEVSDLCALHEEAIAYSAALSTHIDEVTNEPDAIEAASTPTLREIFYKAYETIDRDFEAAINKASAEMDPIEQKKLQITALADQIHYIDLFSQIVAGNQDQMTPSIISTPAANTLMSDALKTTKNAALCREIGAHNLAEIIEAKALRLQ